MASQIISEGGSNCAELSNSQFMRKISIGSSWTTLRIGCRIRFVSEGSITGTPRLNFGLCNFAGGSVGDLSCGNFLGLQTNLGSWSYSTGNMVVMTSSAGGAWRFRHRFGANDIFYGPSSSGNVNNNTAFASSLSSTDKSALIIQFVKTGSPNAVDMSYFRPDYFNFGNTSYAMSTTQFLAVVEGATMSFGGYTTQTISNTFSSETTAGYLDAINLSWDRTAVPCILDDLIVVRVN